jgi:hypothetical protein
MKRIFWVFCINRFLINPLQYLSSRSNFGFEFAEIFAIEKQLPTRQDGESKRFSRVAPFFKLLNKSIVIVHYIPSFFYAKLVRYRAGLAV